MFFLEDRSLVLCTLLLNYGTWLITFPRALKCWDMCDAHKGNVASC